jgi:hypothetical protein
VLAPLSAACAWAFYGCGGAPPPIPVIGPGQSGNQPPSLAITDPIQNLTASQGSRFVIRWTDSDIDSNAVISFSLVDTASNAQTILVEGIEENDTTGPDSFSVTTSLVPVGVYNLLGTISDGVNAPQSVFALIDGQGSDRVRVTITPPGQGPQTVPPRVEVIQPAFNLSVAQDDTLEVRVQPSSLPPNQGRPYDPDSPATMYVVLDLNQNPLDDDPANPQYDPEGRPLDVIPLRQQTIPAGTFDEIAFQIPINLEEVPPRPTGEPYYTRITLDDLNNARVHKYAPGAISVVQLAAGLADLAEVGRTLSGARFYGFNPGANVGSSLSSVSDFDQDGVDDFVIVAQYGNPRNFGLVGEAYLIYGLNGRRFGGALAVNSVSDVISGVIFEGPPIRNRPSNISITQKQIPLPQDELPRTDGITSVSYIRDVTGDGRPDLIFGLGHVHGAFDAMDFDPGDDDLGGGSELQRTEVRIRRGRVTVTRGTGSPSITNLVYDGVEDLVIGSAFPNTPFGSGDLEWQDEDDSNRRFALLKFKDVLDELPDPPSAIDVSQIVMTLELRVFVPGSVARLYRSNSNFDEQTTYGTYSENGGDPEPGVDYDLGRGGFGLGPVDAQEVQTLRVTATDALRALLDGQLEDADNEIRFIIVPDQFLGQDPARVRSSEFSVDLSQRPTLSIQYFQQQSVGALNCYPDNIVNNFTDVADEPFGDWNYHYGGMVVQVNSSNRDNDPPVPDAPRLESTSVALELVGQKADYILSGTTVDREQGSIFARADNAFNTNRGLEQSTPGRIQGARFIAGAYDFIDARSLLQPPRDGLFGQSVASIGDLNNDGLDEIVISAPTNEAYLAAALERDGAQSTHYLSTTFPGSITVIPGHNYAADVSWWDKESLLDATTTIPLIRQRDAARCSLPGVGRLLRRPADTFAVLAESSTDRLGDAQSAGDFNLDGLDDMLCGAPMNNRSSARTETGAAYVLYGRSVLGDYNLRLADDPFLRTPMLRIRGVNSGDRIGTSQGTGLDVNGDRIDDVFVSSPTADYGGIQRQSCIGDYNRDGRADELDLNEAEYSRCVTATGDYVFSDDPCLAFDFNYDRRLDETDEAVFTCLEDGGTNCCANLVDNGFAAVIFGGVFLDGDRDITQIATADLPGAIFYGAKSGDRAGFDISSAGDFNQDGFGDIMIAAPGEIRLDVAGRERLGVVYIIFGGTHLTNTTWNLNQVGTSDLPGMVMLSPYVAGRPNEAPPERVEFIGDINNDGFGDVAIGLPHADFIDLTYPQGPEAPGSDAGVGRRKDAGDCYIVYGNNFGSNRLTP